MPYADRICEALWYRFYFSIVHTANQSINEIFTNQDYMHESCQATELHNAIHSSNKTPSLTLSEIIMQTISHQLINDSTSQIALSVMSKACQCIVATVATSSLMVPKGHQMTPMKLSWSLVNHIERSYHNSCSQLTKITHQSSHTILSTDHSCRLSYHPYHIYRGKLPFRSYRTVLSLYHGNVTENRPISHIAQPYHLITQLNHHCHFITNINRKDALPVTSHNLIWPLI